MNKKFIHFLRLFIAFIDLLAINIVFFISILAFRKYNAIGHDSQYIYFGFTLSAVWLATIAITNLYNEKNLQSFEIFTRATLRTYSYFLMGISIYLFFFRVFELSRIFLSVLLLVIPVVLLLNRFLYLTLFQYPRKKQYLSKVMVVGYNNLSKKLVSYLEEDGINKQVVGFCEEYENVKELSHYPILSNIDGAINVCRDYGISEIYSTIAPEQNASIYKLIKSADDNCIRFRFVPDLGVFMNQKIHIDFVKEIPVLNLRREPLEDVGNRIKKRFFDVLVSSFVMIFILSWLVPLIALLIKLESKGPVFFIQARTGKDMKPFLCFKFRSMYTNKHANELQAKRNDERITRIGKILRKTSLDEFPQFFNVFQGQMSIVGPRPHMLKHTEQYSHLVGQYMVRQFLKPGITGWAQVNGLRGETKTLGQMKKRVEFDLWYMENWNIYLDLRIVFMTVYNMLKGEKNVY